MSVHEQPEIDRGQDNRWGDDSPEVATETREEIRGAEATEQNPPDGYASSETPKSFSTWLREMPQSAKYGVIGFLGVAAVSVAFWAGSQAGKEGTETESSDESIANRDDNESSSGILNNLDSDQSEAETTNDLEADNSEEQEVNEFRERLLEGDKDAWLHQWETEDFINGGRIEDESNPQAAQRFVDNVISHLNRKLTTVAAAESEDGLAGDPVKEVQYLTGATLLLENRQGVFPVENPVVYGLRLDSESVDEGAIYSWSELADSDTPQYINFMMVYSDPDGERQTMALFPEEAAIPSDSSTRIVGAYTRTDREYEIARGELNWDSLQADTDSFVIENQDTPGGIQLETPEVFNTTEEAWEYYVEDSVYEPASAYELLQALRNITND